MKNNKAIMLLISFFLASFAQCSPFIVFDKKIIESDGKVNDPVHVLYRIFNLGDSPATELRIDDSGIPLEQWDFPPSANELRWNSIGPGENITHIFEVKPLTSGSLRMGSSRLRYHADGQNKIALSTQVFWFDAKSTRSIGAKGNIQGYLLVVGVAAASVFLPLLIWLFTRTTKAPAQKTKTN